MKRIFALLAALTLLAPTSSIASTSTAAAEPDKSDNVDHIFEHQYDGVSAGDPYFTSGTDLAFDGDYIYAPQQGGQGAIHIFERLDEAEALKEGAPYKLVSEIPCAGGQNDVAVVESGLLAVAYHSARCGSDTAGAGVSFFDVSDPAAPVKVGEAHGLPGGTHTLTVHPTEPVIYASPGGIPTNGGGVLGGGQAGGGGTQQILDISDLSDIKRHTFWYNASGCHDFEVVMRGEGDSAEELGICVGLGESSIWDLSDPLRPTVLSRFVPPVFFGHSGIATPDGKYLILGDENFGAMECAGGPTGAMWAYDITDPTTPIPVSYFAVGRNAGDNPIYAGQRDRWCTAHLYNFVGDSYTMVASWYTGGMNVIDWSDIRNPREVAHYAMGEGAAASTVNYWSAYWHEGRVYANDRGRGVFDVFEVAGIGPDGDASEMASTTRDGWTGGVVTADVLAAAQQRNALRARAGLPKLACALAATPIANATVAAGRSGF